MYDLPVPTPREIGGETSGSYEGNSTLSGSPDENGRYPIKAETTLEGEEHENERKEKAESQKKEENESVFARSEASHEEERSGDTELNSDIGKNALGWWALGVTMVLALVIFLRWRYGKKDKTK